MPESYTLKRAATAPAQQSDQQPASISSQLSDQGCHSACTAE